MAIPNFFDLIMSYRSGVDTKAKNTENAQITTQSRGTTAWGEWLGPYSNMEVTYPQSQNVGTAVFGTTGAQSAGTIHTHTMDGNSYGQAALWNISVNTAMGTYLKCTQNRFVNIFGAYLYPGNVALAGGQIWFQIWRENQDRSLTRLVNHDCYSAINTPVGNTSTNWIEGSITGGFTVRQGERYLLRIVNKTSPARTIGVVGLESLTGAPDIAHQQPATVAGTETAITIANADTYRNAGGVLMWAYLAAENPPPEDVTYTDDFNRANLGPNWTWLGREIGGDAELLISNGHLVFDGIEVAEIDYIHGTASDYMRVDFDTHEVAGNAITAPEAGVAVFITGDREGFYAALLVIRADTVFIMESHNGSTYAQKAVLDIVGNNATWSFIYDPDTNTYYALKNGEDIGLSWTDSTNLMLHGPNYRYAAIQITADNGIAGGEIDNFVLRDWRG